MARFTKADIEYHGTHNGYWPAPAVNVKTQGGYVTRALVEQVAADNDQPTFVRWWDENESKLSDDTLTYYWQSACEDAWETLQDDAEEIFGRGVKVYSAGRSGGWAYIEQFKAESHGSGYDVTDGWDAIDVAKWGKFARWARLIADDVEYQMVQMILINLFQPEHEAAQKRAFRDLIRSA